MPGFERWATAVARGGWMLLAFMAVASSAQAAAADGPPSQPNVLLIYCDDLNMDLQSFGHPTVVTPNIDRLAARGLRFTHSYCPLPLCLPSRLAMMSGQLANRTGCYLNTDVEAAAVINGIPVMPGPFTANGYRAGSAGKIFHDGAAIDGLWHETYQEWDDYWISKPSNPVPGDGNVLYWGPFLNGDGSLGKAGDSKNAERVIDMIQRFSDPFFIAMGFRAPHFPFIYPERFGGFYDPSQDVPALPWEETNVDWKHDGIPKEAYISQNYLDPAYQSDPERGRREATVAYWRSITWIDEEVGRILDALEQSGKADSTIVVFMGDHGFSFGTHAKFGKWTLFDSDARAPLLIAVPWIPATHGQICTSPVNQLDLYPTLMELSGLAVHPDLESESLVPSLYDVNAPRGPAFSVVSRSWYTQVQRMVRTPQYKFVYWEDGKHMLFDLLSDPGEYYNLYNNSGYGNVVNQHLDLLKDRKLLRADFNEFGVGTDGTLGEPKLSLTGRPILGAKLKLKMNGSSPGLSLSAMLFGRFSMFQETAWGIAMVQPSWLSLNTINPGDNFIPFTVPNDSRLIGLSAVMQLVQQDSGALSGIAASRGLRVFVWNE